VHGRQGSFAARRLCAAIRYDPIFIVGCASFQGPRGATNSRSPSQVGERGNGPYPPRLVSQAAMPRLATHNPRYPRVLASLSAGRVKQYSARNILADNPGVPHRQSEFSDRSEQFPSSRFDDSSDVAERPKSIEARREIHACCFRNFKAAGSPRQEFTYASRHRPHYCTYIELMAALGTCVACKVLRVQHEDVSPTLEGQCPRLLYFSGLEVEPACHRFLQDPTNCGPRASESVSNRFKEVPPPPPPPPPSNGGHFEPWLFPLGPHWHRWFNKPHEERGERMTSPLVGVFGHDAVRNTASLPACIADVTCSDNRVPE